MLHGTFPPEVFLEGATTRMTALSREHQGPRAVLNALERLIGAYATESERVQKDLEIAKAQLRDYQLRVGKPFALEEYHSQLTALRDQLKAGLSGTASESSHGEGPSVSELAERIKVLKSAQSIDATPQRTRNLVSTAEEPVTTRIRRRVAAKSDATAWGELDPALADNLDFKPELAMTFQERAILERHHKDGVRSPA